MPVSAVKECYGMFEVDGGITTAQLGLAMRALGQNPTESEVQAMAAQAQLSGEIRTLAEKRHRGLSRDTNTTVFYRG